MRTTGFRPRRRLGQNFLVDARARRRILEALAPGPGQVILEIGPGKGELTAAIGRAGARVIAVEIDPDLEARARAACAQLPNVEVRRGDALELELSELVEADAGLRIFGNLPYATGTAILRRLLPQSRWIRDLTLLLQREVAQRLTAGPGSEAYGYLSVAVQLRAQVHPLFDIGPQSFRPRPRIVSRLIQLRPFQPAPSLPSLLDPVLSAAFQYRRKRLATALRHHPAFRDRPDLRGDLARAGVDPDARGESLSPAAFLDLAGALARESR